MDITNRTNQLNELFGKGERIRLEESKLDVISMNFKQTLKEEEICDIQKELFVSDFQGTNDNRIQENKSFHYYIFHPEKQKKNNKAIFLFHGLNERSWKKYLTWAEYLAEKTRKSVVLFPIAFHMNRTPLSWTNPHAIFPWVSKRKDEVSGVQNSSFVNVALSCRLSKDPVRLYISGWETVHNIRQLMYEIKNGEHPLFEEDTSINLFGYSIGALLSQVLLISNPENLFKDSKLFMFCGGSIFCEINGNARDIIDSEANDRLQNYYKYEFIEKNTYVEDTINNRIQKAFKSMIRPDVLKNYRESFFRDASERLRVISLKKDSVVLTSGVQLAFGKSADKILNEWDFSYNYSHQWPFPLNRKEDAEMINRSFVSVFDQASSFLG